MNPLILITDIWNKLNSPEILQNILGNRFILILFVVVLSRLKNKTGSSMFLTALINVPGTFLHETAHFIVGFLLNARPTSFSLFPKKSGSEYVAGLPSSSFD